MFNIWFFRFLWGLESVDWSQKAALQILTPGESPWAGRWISLGRFLLPQMDNKKADLTGLLLRSYWQKTKKQKRSYWQTDMKHSGTDSGWALHFVYKMMTWKLLTGSKVIVARIKRMLVVPARPSWPNPSHLPFLHAPFLPDRLWFGFTSLVVEYKPQLSPRFFPRTSRERAAMCVI